MHYMIKQEVQAFHSGQMDCRLVLQDAQRKTIGTLLYTVYRGAPSIRMIQVIPSHRRQGHATRMLAHLQRLYPDQEIDWGMLTKDGSALHAQIPVKLVPTEWARDFARLARIGARLKAMDADILAGNGKTSLAAYYCLRDHHDSLEHDLRGLPAHKRILDIPAHQAAEALSDA